ncbi:MAG: hypothetical protein J0H14_16520 [Alphaproteobacteria bacterium]|nr:hypothetical protein [Alphaproteobacteria bacterium]
MPDALVFPPARALTLQFLAWVSVAERRRADVMEVWQSSCPRLSIWEDALLDGLVRFEDGRVELTGAGRAMLDRVP